MKYFIKLNVFSILYAFMIFVLIQLMGNIYRISRLTGWNIDTVISLSFVVIIIVFILGTYLHFFLSKKEWMKGRKSRFWTVILWVPYFILFVYTISSLFPITYEGDTPNPSSGLIAILALIVFPFYILVINSIDFTSQKKN